MAHEELKALIQGYTADQWQTIIDGGFICEFGDLEWRYETWGMLEGFHEQSPNFMDKKEDTYSYCRPLRTKGVRQPWFGGECPINSSALVVVTLADGDNRCAKASEFNWHVPDNKSRRIVEFIEL